LKTSIVIKRLKAFAIDYFIIAIYIGFLFGATLLISRIFHLHPGNTDPVTAELIAFTTLTLPVILYFVISENGRYAGTIGKRKLGLHVMSNTLIKASPAQLLLRNFIKFLPWELAHFFIYRLFSFTSINKPIPDWVLAGLIISQALAIIYLLCVIFIKNNRSIYELISQTRVVQN
jgi:uncharacterized RDD family membrane protein YckC